MARIVLSFRAEQFCYSTRLTVRSTDINFANHLGNDAMVSLISEARMRFLADFGYGENRPDQEDRINIIATDLAVTYRAEAYFRDELLFEVGVADLNRYGGDFIFRISRPADKAVVALAKCGFVFFDYATKKVVPLPEGFAETFSVASPA